MHRQDIFATPIFTFEVDMDKLVVPYQPKDYKPTFESKLKTTYTRQHVPNETYAYLRSVIAPALNSLQDPWKTMKFVDLWRNRYEEHDYQATHLHPKTQWSFIIYEDVESKTLFMHPAHKLIQNQAHAMFTKDHEYIFEPKLPAGNMILFPSWIEHQVVQGNKGHTIEGNIQLTD